MKYPAYPKYKESGVEWLGDVPEHWEVKKLKSIGYFKAGAGFPDTEQGNEEEELPFFKVGDMNNDGNDIFMSSSNNTVSRHTAKLLGAHIFKKDTVIFAKVGAALLLNRRRIIVRDSCLDNNTMGYIIDKADHKYIFYWLSPLDFGRLSNPGAVPSINDGQLREIPIALPLLPEQQAIAAFLDRETGRINMLIDKKQKLIALLKEKRTALLSRAVTKGLNPKVKMKPSGVEWLGDVPEHWNIDRLRRSSTRVTDGAHISPDLSSEDYAFVSTVDIKNGLIDFNNCLKTSSECYKYLVENNCRPFKDDVLFSKDGTVGRTALIDFDRNFVVASSLVIISPVRSRIEPKFLNYWLNNSLVQQDVALQMSGAALRRISVEKIGRLPIVIPPLPEQQPISEFLDRKTNEIDVLITKVETVINKLEEYRTALISAAVTGKIDVSTGLNTSVREVA